MPTIAVKDRDLLEAVKRLPPMEFDAFIEEALSLRKPAHVTLSEKESKLITQINRGLTVDLRKRCAQLAGRQKKES